MTDDSQELDQDTGSQTQPDTPDTEEPKTFDVAYVKNLRAESAGYRTKLRELEAAQTAAAEAKQQAEKERLEKQNEFETLYKQAQERIAELEPYQVRIDELTAAAKATNEKRIESLPETMRTLVPDYTDPFKLAAWLDANAEVFTKPASTPLNGGAGSSGRGQTAHDVPTEATIREQAARLNVSAKHLAMQYGVELT